MSVLEYSAEENEKRPRCPECGSAKRSMDSEHGEVVCNNCGLVLEDHMLDPGPEWRAYDAEQRRQKERGGPPTKSDYHDRGLSTDIGWDRDASGRQMTAAEKARAYRLRTTNTRTRIRGSKDRNLAQAFAKMSTVGSRAGIPKNVVAVAAELYRQIVDQGYPKGRAIDQVVPAVLYYASRKMRAPTTLYELQEASGIPEKHIGRAYRKICEELHSKPPIDTPMDHVPTIASALELSGETEQKMRKVLEQYFLAGMCSGKSPKGVAAGAGYMVSQLEGEDRTQRQAAKAANVTEVTVRNHYREMAEYLTQEFEVFSGIFGKGKLDRLEALA